MLWDKSGKQVATVFSIKRKFLILQDTKIYVAVENGGFRHGRSIMYLCIPYQLYLHSHDRILNILMQPMRMPKSYPNIA